MLFGCNLFKTRTSLEALSTCLNSYFTSKQVQNNLPCEAKSQKSQLEIGKKTRENANESMKYLSWAHFLLPWNIAHDISWTSNEVVKICGRLEIHRRIAHINVEFWSKLWTHSCWTFHENTWILLIFVYFYHDRNGMDRTGQDMTSHILVRTWHLTIWSGHDRTDGQDRTGQEQTGQTLVWPKRMFSKR